MMLLASMTIITTRKCRSSWAGTVTMRMTSFLWCIPKATTTRFVLHFSSFLKIWASLIVHRKRFTNIWLYLLPTSRNVKNSLIWLLPKAKVTLGSIWIIQILIKGYYGTLFYPNFRQRPCKDRYSQQIKVFLHCVSQKNT